MKTAGIIAEYDPFHNGHLSQIQRLRTMGWQRVVVCLGTVCAQRGGFYLLEDGVRAGAALSAGADLVLAIPAPFSGSGAESFAAAGVRLLSAVGCKAVCFGAETPNADLFMQTARVLDSPALTEQLRRRMQQGLAYAPARQSALKQLFSDGETLLQQPNNILGVEYCKAILRQGCQMQPLPILRKGAAHGEETPREGTASASLLRSRFAEYGSESWQGLVPPQLEPLYADACRQGLFTNRSAESIAILSRLRALSKEELSHTRGLSEGLEHRLYDAVQKAANLTELEEQLATKRYPRARLRRLYMDAALGYTDALPALPPYLHVLAGRRDALSLLKGAALPAGTSLADLARLGPDCARVAQAQSAAANLSALCRNTPGCCGEAYTRKPVFPQEK